MLKKQFFRGGNNRTACFFSDEDYLYYLETLGQQAEKYGCAIHAYILMTNHVYLLVTPDASDSASLMMKHLGQRYVQHINRNYRRSGTLWEGRFKSCLAQDERYVLACYRYIEMNPVRANMVAHPGDYRWSSFAFNGKGESTPLITPNREHLKLGAADPRLEGYKALFSAHLDSQLDDEIREATNGNYVFGDQGFQDQI